jgi:photoactive yellow protein
VQSSTLANDGHYEVFDLSRDELDDLPFGVITLDRLGKVLRYNRFEELLACRSAETTVGLYFFTDIAPCTNVQAFRGRFDTFASSTDAGVERFDFSFNFRWGRQDVSITMLRKAAHDDINIIVRGHLMGATSSDTIVDRRKPSPTPQKPRLDVGIATNGPAQAQPPPVAFRFAGPAEDAQRRSVHIDDAAAVARLVADAERDRTPYVIEYRSRRPDHSVAIIQESGCFPSADAPGCATLLDVTAQRQRDRALAYAVNYDALTGLPNLKLFLKRIADAVIECEANGGIAAVFVINIHKFAAVSDRFGYQTGDRLLQLLTLRLGECVRGGDTVARLGFDRFALLLAGIDTGLSATDAATRIIAAVSQPFIIDEQTHYVTLSIGLSLAPYDSRDETAVLHAADTAMRAARAAGANGFLWYHPDMSVDSTKDARCSNELRSALKNTEFELHYQPIVDIERDRVVAVESLVRWNHPTRGLVGPGEFIALADRTGLIIPLGEWVLREACRQAREWQDQGRTLRVCVNVSAVQFRLPNFVSLVASILTEHELAPDRLELELTESVMVDGFGDMIEKLGQLKSMGLRLSIDDFGTGYSSLAYLKYFPVDTLKIDRAFITDITTDTYDRAIAKSVLTLANDLGLECIAEGVENADQLETLRAIGSTLIQGYYFCKPMKPEKLSALLSGSVAAMLH